jgi:pentatricopeptide repeat protein
MENMARDLIPMTAQAYDFLIAGRSYHEPEHALRTLQEVNARGLTPLSSSYVSVIHAFTRTKEPDVALAVLREGERRDNMPIFSYFDVMEASADAKYAEGVDHCWKTLMANKILVHEGACLKLLRYAASTGKAALAGEVVRHLTNQNYKCGAEHLGPLFEAFVRANDSAAFGVLELMEKAGIPIDRGIVSVWTEQLSTSIEALNRGIRQLQQLNMPREDGSLRGPVHVALFNSILDAAVALGNIELAAETFQSASKYGVKPNVDSYNAMLVVCRELKQINVANELYEEMLRNNIQPNRTTFHRLVSVACSVERDESYEDAFKYLELTKAAGMIPNFNTYVELARRCAISRDARATIVLEEMETFGYPVSDELKQFVESGGLSDKLQTLKESNQRFGRPNKTIPRAILSSKNISIR